METWHQEQVDNLQRTMREANECLMKMAENHMIQMKEAMMAITQQQSASPILVQLILPHPPAWTPPPVRQQYIASPVKPIPSEQIVDGWGNKWRVYTHCKRMGMHDNEDCELLEKNKGRREERLKSQKREREVEGKEYGSPKNKCGRKK